jgi:serine/threonine-protein kinase
MAALYAMVLSTKMVPSEGSPPMRIDRYELCDLIASGGMATVHIGRLVGPAGFGRTVAIKRLHPHLAKEAEFVTMLTDEARVAGRIGHPNIVPTLDVVASDGELFLVMDYVPGLTLAALAKHAHHDGERLPLPVACAIMCDVLHGLDAAHEARDESGHPLEVVHRDVSPQNILVGADGVTRLLDFGIAKAAGRLHITRDGQLKGKVGYMAPEQLAGRAVDRRTDIYAASVVLWETLADARLFDGQDEAAIFGKVMQMKVPPPSVEVAGIPAELDVAVLSGLEREPSRRYARARDMALVIERAAPLARASEVAAWVARLGERELAERASLVTAIEQRGAAKRQGRHADGAVARQLLDHHGQALDGAIEAVRPPAAQRYRPKRAALFAAAAGILAAGAAAIFAATRGASGHAVIADVAGSPAESAAATAQDRTTPRADLAAPLAAPRPPESERPAQPSAPVGSATTSMPKTPPSVRSSAPRPPTQRSHVAKSTDCDPPFTIDEQGHKHYKVDCL